jgi:hypothetical protein
MAYQRVVTVWDFYDGPRTGISFHCGVPHHFDCQWDNEADEYSDVYLLSPVSKELLSHAEEQWQIFRQWELAFHQGEVPAYSHPGNKGQNCRYDELDESLRSMLATRTPIGRFHGLFRAVSGQVERPLGVLRELEVAWSPVI